MEKCIFSLLMLILTMGGALAQDKLDFGNTSTTSLEPTYKSKKKDYKNEHLVSIIKKDTKGLLLGNRCLQDVTRDMGFEYVVQPKREKLSMNGFERLIHNFGAKLKITFKNGPFWKFRLKKKRKECKQQTGDFVG